ncbi:acid-sensing ion channel 1-like [Elysia marginata]|uniref:Acid-sensing ion channel 1-like n=1 Tax=Elysia marginata TaxID=1093978 RepID=A0AAV4JSH0_9GAST|nr:acid-sensing ion channel 1-like [Elysia marginata]
MTSNSTRKRGYDEPIRFNSSDEKLDCVFENEHVHQTKEPKDRGRHDFCCQEDWVDFTEQTSLHGLRYIWLRQAAFIRRLLWLVLTLLCAGIMMYQICDRAIYYYSWPVTVNVKINFNETLHFPTLTICNQNAFRATAAEATGHYALITRMFRDEGAFNTSFLDAINATNITFGTLYSHSGHQPKDMIIGCKWKGEECGWWNFSQVATDSGLCFSFNAEPRKGGREFLTVDNPGSENGLSLTINVEQYEYMPGPSDASGVKILLHHPHQFPKVRGLGLALPPGSFAFVGTSMISVSICAS